MNREPILSPEERAFFAAARRATLATLDPDGKPRLVPVCFILGDEDDKLGRPLLYTPIDEKTKASPDPKQLSRVKDLLVLPEAVLIADRWDEDWSRLGWVRVYGRGEILEPQPHEREEHAKAVKALRAKYEQYRDHHLETRPIIRVTIGRSRSWGNLAPASARGAASARRAADARGKARRPAGGGSASSSSPGDTRRR
jgi:coenzyme F420-0:L-glutamate ligase/coenzyme F420-1:gamma-L-glutamate ligase